MQPSGKNVDNILKSLLLMVQEGKHVAQRLCRYLHMRRRLLVPLVVHGQQNVKLKEVLLVLRAEAFYILQLVIQRTVWYGFGNGLYRGEKMRIAS